MDPSSSFNFSALNNGNTLDAESATQPEPKNLESKSTLSTTPLDDIKASLKGKFDLKELSVISSNKIEKRVTRVLEHLGQFSWVDMSVLPGVVLAFAKEKDITKLISVMEVVKRRIHEDHQKWFQYNGLYYVEKPEELSVIEETAMNGMDIDDAQEEDDEDDTFETLPGAAGKAGLRDQDSDLVMPDHIMAAVTGDPKPDETDNLFMAIFLTRVFVLELKSHPDFTLQTNEAAINAYRAERFG